MTMYLRDSLVRNVKYVTKTPLSRIFTFGKAPDFIVSEKITKTTLLSLLLPFLDDERANLHY